MKVAHRISLKNKICLEKISSDLAALIWKSRWGLHKHAGLGNRTVLNKVGGLREQTCKKDLRRQLIVLVVFREHPECTVDAEVVWRLFKASVTSSAARVCGRKRLSVENNVTT